MPARGSHGTYLDKRFNAQDIVPPEEMRDVLDILSLFS
jgi:hypothetical protein